LGVDAWTTVAISLGSAVLGAFAAGAAQIYLDLRDRRIRRKVAAMIVLGDIAVAEAAFELLIERKEWFRHDFGPALATWEKVRGDFAAAVEVADWAEVDAFYSNLARTAAMARPLEPATESDLSVAASQADYAASAWAVAIRYVEATEAERDEVVRRLGPSHAPGGAETKGQERK
jgi:pimeloyl-ACP methyl ester carboxylesterase